MSRKGGVDLASDGESGDSEQIVRYPIDIDSGLLIAYILGKIGCENIQTCTVGNCMTITCSVPRNTKEVLQETERLPWYKRLLKQT
ncbi:MAG: hypothetical protein JW922_01970 [Paludibacteraceae bacterium]|nr:hypothetical protein [Paludibacteraceae bacterium]